VKTISETETPALTWEERKAKKELKRQKQRETDVGRAEKMHYARLAAAGEAVPIAKEPPALNVGCSGWFYWHWRNIFYPAGMPTRNWFTHYATHQGSVELNAPFYSWPTVNAVKVWQTQAGERPFVYTVKVCELITHVKKFRGTKILIRDFGYIADLLGERMGCFLFQVPPSFDYTPARLKAIVAQLDPVRRNVVEFRHKTWWNSKVKDAFRQHGITFCSCSAPRLPDELVKTTQEVYIRFHGKTKWYRHDYSEQELAEWKRRIRASGCQRVWAYFNNDREGFALKNSTEFRALLSAR
jgi:uncharacterized protein YecE (DUF72 family)